MFSRSATPPKPPSVSSPVTMRVSMVFRARSTSAASGGEVRNLSSSSSIAFSSSSAVWPGRAVASIWNIEPSISEYCCALTSCAICLS